MSSQIRLYADDILLFRQIHSIEDSLILQRDLDAIMKWSENWNMFFNFSKCVHFKITNKRTTTDFTYFVKQHQIHQSRNAT